MCVQSMWRFTEANDAAEIAFERCTVSLAARGDMTQLIKDRSMAV